MAASFTIKLLWRRHSSVAIQFKEWNIQRIRLARSVPTWRRQCRHPVSILKQNVLHVAVASQIDLLFSYVDDIAGVKDTFTFRYQFCSRNRHSLELNSFHLRNSRMVPCNKKKKNTNARKTPESVPRQWW